MQSTGGYKSYRVNWIGLKACWAPAFSELGLTRPRSPRNPGPNRSRFERIPALLKDPDSIIPAEFESCLTDWYPRFESRLNTLHPEP